MERPTKGSTSEQVAPLTDVRRAPRLKAAARKKSILEAARRAFSETGDVKGTTIRVIAERAGISEAVIYRHFPSKDQLFIEAVVEPLTEAIDNLVWMSEHIDRGDLVTPERQLETMNSLYRQLISMLDEVMPLLGLVLFGGPQVAQSFYREILGPAMDRLADAWRSVEERYGFTFAAPEISVRAVMGIALMLALEQHHDTGLDPDRAISAVSMGTFTGFFPLATRSSEKSRASAFAE